MRLETCRTGKGRRSTGRGAGRNPVLTPSGQPRENGKMRPRFEIHPISARCDEIAGDEDSGFLKITPSGEYFIEDPLANGREAVIRWVSPQEAWEFYLDWFDAGEIGKLMRAAGVRA